jgi:hypothetical protein
MSTRTASIVIAVFVAAPGSARADVGLERACCTTLEEHPHCIYEDTDVVGYRSCPAYGSWGDNLRDPYVFVDVGMTMRHFAWHGPLASARSTSGQPPEGSSDDALLFDERIGFLVLPGIYIAGEFELGDMVPSDAPKANGHAVVVDGLVAAGVRGGLGPFVLRGELAGGVMAASSTTRDLPTEGVLEGRGRIDLWLSPWFSVGGVIGASLIDRGDWMAGLFLGFHTWAFAGDRW